MGEHLPCKQGVKGSNPSISTRFEEQETVENRDMYLENFILNDTINNLTVRSSRKRMEDTQDIRGKKHESVKII